MNRTRLSEPQPGSEWIVGGGEMGRLIRAMNWSHTPLGPIASWPQSLRTTVNLCLASDLPICIIWGPELVQLYNDGYRVICGGKHPRSMGQNFPECWREAWPVIGAAHDSALAGNTAFLENQHIFLERHGYMEECFFTFSFSPIRDETGRLAGLFHPVIEMTPKMLGERRTRTLRDLAGRVSNAKSIEDAFTLTTEALSEYPLDLPFVLIYRRDETEQQARLVAATGLAPGTKGAPDIVPLNAPDHAAWPLGEVFRAGEAMPVDDVAARFGNFAVGPFPEPIASVVLLPITTPGAERPVAVVIAGISPRLKSSEMYCGFHDLLSGAITTAVANACAYDAERKRAEALAKIDRAKTAFFSNVSHEFRTPLTLMLGPLEDALAGADLPAHERARLDVAHRNALRLLKLVNSLLDFSRIEAGRAQATYEPVDLAALTTVLASNFRSACERAGLALVVDCPPLPEPVYVDRDMWEKIVLNLLSNAFKFTFEGEIAVRLRADGGHAELTVRDTGVGIPEPELPRLFERFHRIEGQRSRTYEGSGIGLALVQELVKLHSGAIHAESTTDHGSTFTVVIPFGTAHLPRDRIGAESSLASTLVRADAYVEEALRWLPADSALPLAESAGEIDAPGTVPGLREGARILFADDNADMRAYVRGLLGRHYAVETVMDGEAALAAIRERRPDLVLADVMMPRLDGFGLLHAIRADPALRDLSVILLSARAGEEARVEGLEAGADDYLTKPFSARELIARIGGNLQLARARREADEALRHVNSELGLRLAEIQAANAQVQDARRAALNLMEDAVQSRQAAETLNAALLESERRFRFMAESIPAKIFTAKPSGEVDYFNPQWTEFTGLPFEQIRDWGWTQFIHPDDVAENVRVWQHSIDTGEPFRFEHRFRTADGEYRWHLSRAVALKNAEGKVVMWVGSNADVHEVKEADRRKDEFLAMLAHELRGPLAPLSNMLEIMKRAQGRDDLIQQARSTMQRQVGQMTRLIDDLLDASRISRDKLDLRLGQVELASIVHHAVEACRPAIEAARHELRVTLPPQPVYLHADPVRLGQVFTNLLSNACKFTEPGGRIALTAEREGPKVVVSVKDDGIGIPPDMLHGIFEMFTQVDRSLDRARGGLGIGLTLVKQLVEMHGGSVKAYSEGHGLGSELVVRLPVSTEKPEPAAEPTFNAPALERRILVVDDNRDAALSLAMLLQLAGHEIRTAHDGLEAVEAAAAFRPDLVLLDIGLPKLNGYEVARRIRGEPWGRDIALIALTGWGQDEDRRKSREAGFDGHLVKPVDHAALTKVLAESRATPG